MRLVLLLIAVLEFLVGQQQSLYSFIRIQLNKYMSGVNKIF